jgi:hypothetical protein
VSIRVVLYSEGAGETGGEISLLPPPGDPLRPEHLGPAHELLRRCVASSGIPEGAVIFLSPLRTRGRQHKGSDLLKRQRLRELLTWPAATRRPDLAVVMVDSDGDRDRRSNLENSASDLSIPTVLAVPVKEFEAWLIADQAAVTKALDYAPDKPPHVETLDRRAAKDLLKRWVSEAKPSRDEASIRATLARTADLNLLAELPAFRTFQEDLRAKLSI